MACRSDFQILTNGTKLKVQRRWYTLWRGRAYWEDETETYPCGMSEWDMQTDTSVRLFDTKQQAEEYVQRQLPPDPEDWKVV